MSRFLAEPPGSTSSRAGRRPAAEPRHAGRADRRRAVRRYLAEFLSDRRVVEIPGFLWKPILHLVDPARSPGAVGEKIRDDLGQRRLAAPHHSQKQKTLLMGYLGQRLKDQGLPSDFRAGRARDALRQPGDRGRARPAPRGGVRSHSRGAALSRSIRRAPRPPRSTRYSPIAQRMRRLPGLRTVDCFHDDPGYIRALARNVNDYWMRHGRPDRLVHELSWRCRGARSISGDPYHCQCQKTARLLATELGLEAEQFARHVPVALRPRRMAQALYPGHAGAPRQGRCRAGGRVCPGFVSDCLETLEEIGIEVKQAFLGPAVANSTRFPVSTSIRTGSPPWSTSCSRISRDGSPPGCGGARGDADARQGDGSAAVT